ncbi:MAG: hypothetical protein COW00_04730 [Bdellovibrio sp. CG12_big_fil_rev_8_21_14_0_65_39_13]|nr:MAG: hypothetical protein COW78_12930 [Bdellovibrio sp. CG22_combo_CG10-13_8_21_14_all_39_27]PIQ61115.1 MAG: hypothetical protein COW00_04730 [Bdellovibrio sp. CG12_big_fil_rev_8_21_14_0_65_39_13]PIR36883.1 MAG: hypothetical protein COV37_01750 [Bdellovibrio sp. CG11_big_fil_rev_8_21_14_0_20_39_38]PJB52278.1 MAG: hypothetical protein CO099_13405 [Bdellovibrio sp. CG_4_9_14_3_um_filter_39_7]
MEVVKKTDSYTIIKKRSGRFGVKHKNGRWINGDEKTKVLLAEGLIKAPAPKEVAAEAGPDTTTEEVGAQ